MAYVAPSTVSTGDSITSVAHNIIVNDILNHEDRIVSASMAGMVTAFAGASAPTGWLLCDGAAVSRTTYATLFTALGGVSSPFGLGDGSTTFNTPNLLGRAIVGLGTGAQGGGSGTGVITGGTALTARARGAWFGEEAHTIAVGELPVHTHGIPALSMDSQGSHAHTTTIKYNALATYSLGGSSNGVSGIPGATGATSSSPTSTTTDGAHQHTTTASTTNGSTAPSTTTNVMAPSLVLNYIIKY